MSSKELDIFYCLWIHDLLTSTFNPENKVSTWGDLRIQKVDILGTVVSARRYEKRSEYDLDDSTGVIRCCWFHRSTPGETDPLAALPLGTRLHVRGGLQEYRGRKEVVAYNLRVVRDPCEQSARVFRQAALYRQVYAPGDR